MGGNPEVGFLLALPVVFACVARAVPFGFLRWHPRGGFAARALPLVFVFFAGIRVAPSRRRRCPCAGRHLLSLPPQRK
jgi:hypothetical protein